jgi:hypothetical protein
MSSRYLLAVSLAAALALAGPIALAQTPQAPPPVTMPRLPAPSVQPSFPVLPSAPSPVLPEPVPVMPSAPMPAPAAAPPAEISGYSDVCRVEPKPPWCREGSVTRAAPDRE